MRAVIASLLFVCFGFAAGLSVGQPLSDAGEVLKNSKVSVVPDMESINEASKIIAGLAQIPAPKSSAPAPSPVMVSCERDFSSKCPEQFVNVGAIFGG